MATATRWRMWAVVVMVGGSMACASQSPTTPTTTTGTSSQAVSGLAALSNPEVGIYHVDAASGSRSDRGPCEFDPATGQFVCPNQSRDGLTLTRQFTLYDAAGNVQSAYHPMTTASIRMETTVTGTTTRGPATVTINRSGVMVTSGLEGQETTRTLNGLEQGTVTSTHTAEGMTVTTQTALTHETNRLVIPVRADRNEPAYPLSGTKVHTQTTTVTRGSDSRTTTMRRVETFNGTSIVQVEITMNGVTRTCTIDLAARTNTCGDR